MNEAFIWIGIGFCLTQSAMFSGLNLAFFSLTRLRLEIEAESAPSNGAKRVLAMREDSNFLLTTILWGNVGINVLLTLLSDSVMAGVLSFAFSTGVITLFGEIVPQAYFSRNALRMASMLAPVLQFYKILLFPVAKPSALLLDSWLGKESVQFFAEKNIKLFIKKHMEDYDSEIDHIEGTGAINFFSMDDMKIIQEGEELNADSILSLESSEGKLLFPKFEKHLEDPFIKRINKSGEKWILLCDETKEPKLALDADGFLRSELICEQDACIEDFCHVPIVLKDENTNLGMLIKELRGSNEVNSDAPIEKDVGFVWTEGHKRIITGADILGRLFKGM